MTGHQWKVGDHVADIVGESGIIRDVDHENGDLILLLDRIVPALSCWNNMLAVRSADTGALKRIGRMWPV
jgi:hypothetical protein